MADKVMKLGFSFFFCCYKTLLSKWPNWAGDIRVVVIYFFSIAPHPDFMKPGWSPGSGKGHICIYSVNSALAECVNKSPGACRRVRAASRWKLTDGDLREAVCR